MSVTIQRKLKRDEKKEVIKSYIDEAQFLLERALTLGFTLNELMDQLTPGQKDLVEKMIITNDCNTVTEYSKVRGITRTRAGQIIHKVYLIFKRFLIVKFLYEFGRTNLRPVYQENIYGNWTGAFKFTREHMDVSDQIKEIQEEIFLLPDDDIKKLASISNHIHLFLKE